MWGTQFERWKWQKEDKRLDRLQMIVEDGTKKSKRWVWLMDTVGAKVEEQGGLRQRNRLAISFKKDGHCFFATVCALYG